MRFSLHRKKQTSNGAWVVAVDMGYGHQRAALPLRKIARDGAIITVNDYSGIPSSDRQIWRESQRFYEIVSRFKKFPILGDFVFSLFDEFQKIEEFYPKDQPIHTPTFQLKQVYSLMEKQKWGRHLIRKLNKNPVPLITTFFIPAYMAEYWGYAGPVYLLIPDTDVSRAWAPFRPQLTKIRYCVPTARVAERLKRYGVPQSNIFFTGFPLPEDFTEKNSLNARKDLKRRLVRLDPREQYRKRYAKLIGQHVGALPKSKRRPSPVSVTFAIGGAGAQADIAEIIMESLAPFLKQKKIKFNIVAGVHARAAVALKTRAIECGLSAVLKKNLFIFSCSSKKEYFKGFGNILHATDILWTKPSELVFYAALGVPLILAPPIGSQEVFNRRWLMKTGAGLDQMNPALTHEWLPDLVEQGALAKAALQGFVEIPRNGADNIKKLIMEGKTV